MFRVFLDTEVVLDLLRGTKEWAPHLEAIWDMTLRDELAAYIAEPTLTRVFHAGHGAAGLEAANTLLELCLDQFHVVAVGSDELRAAIDLPGSSIEDKLQMTCAAAADADYFITRKVDQFSGGPVRALTPKEFIEVVHQLGHHSLQVLVSEFVLRKNSKAGLELDLCIPADAPRVCTRKARNEARTSMTDFEAKVHVIQGQLDGLLSGPAERPWCFAGESFQFRYVSGGVLPVLRMGERDYYCLFYRDMEPVGWNIANGGADTREELLDPRITIEREFCEELVIFGDDGRHIFQLACERSSFHASQRSRQRWHDTMRELTGNAVAERKLEFPWVEGPDVLRVSIVRHGKSNAFITEDKNQVTGCFININALDFGIELDRVARIPVDESVIVCDGELIGSRQINRPVGLFETGLFNEMVAGGATRFAPQMLFHDGHKYDGERLDEVVREKYLPGQFEMRDDSERNAYRDVEKKTLHYNLCPVTRNIVKRYVQSA